VANRTESLVGFDWRHSREGRRRLAGVDEAGRGCWAGPVVAAAVVLPPGWGPAGLDDSKCLSGAVRESLYADILAGAEGWSACAVSAATIDSINILQATLRAMSVAVRKLAPPPDLLLVDGLHTPAAPCERLAVVRGDGKSAAVAAASIVAKVLRDRIMRAWDHYLPGYGFAQHKGYGSRAHREALRRLGPCRLHRQSWRPILELRQGSLWNESR
jgi:ribonuclease HII